jgi:molecular chaperone GrpE
MASVPIEDENQELPSDEDLVASAAASATDDQVQKLKAERDSLFERLARATAEFKNAQKRGQIEMDQRAQYANSSLIKSLLPVIDNFERALAVDPEKVDAKSILKGMQIVHDQWLSVLKQQEVQEINPAPGTPFDPSQHEAIMQQESKYKVPTVVQLFNKGYSLHGRTLRPAQVVVSKSE